jgi:hypothetical protein
VIRPEAASRLRGRLLKEASLALDGIRASADSRDRLAFLLLCLGEVRRSVDQTADAWEKRGYWVKADRFRAEWQWLQAAEGDLAQALAAGDVEVGVELAGGLNGRLPQATPPRKRAEAPLWRGAWERWSSR